MASLGERKVKDSDREENVGRGRGGGQAWESDRDRDSLPPSFISCGALGNFISFFVSLLKWVSLLHSSHGLGES